MLKQDPAKLAQYKTKMNNYYNNHKKQIAAKMQQRCEDPAYKKRRQDYYKDRYAKIKELEKSSPNFIDFKRKEARSDYYKKRYELLKQDPDKYQKLKTYMKEAGKRAYLKRMDDPVKKEKLKEYMKDRYQSKQNEVKNDFEKYEN